MGVLFKHSMPRPHPKILNWISTFKNSLPGDSNGQPELITIVKIKSITTKQCPREFSMKKCLMARMLSNDRHLLRIVLGATSPGQLMGLQQSIPGTVGPAFGRRPMVFSPSQ